MKHQINACLKKIKKFKQTAMKSDTARKEFLLDNICTTVKAIDNRLPITRFSDQSRKDLHSLAKKIHVPLTTEYSDITDYERGLSASINYSLKKLTEFISQSAGNSSQDYIDLIKSDIDALLFKSIQPVKQQNYGATVGKRVTYGTFDQALDMR